jgi:hypothetical protein
MPIDLHGLSAAPGGGCKLQVKGSWSIECDRGNTVDAMDFGAQWDALWPAQFIV